MDHKLRAFIAIAEEKNLSHAAKKIGLAQPSLTKKLKVLEEEYGARLFDRKARGMALTAQGACLYRNAKKIEQKYLTTHEEMRALNSGHLDELRIDAGPTFHLLYLSRVFAQLRKAFPKTKLVLSTQTVPVPLPELLNGEIDIVVGRIYPEIQNPELLILPLLTIEHGVVMSKDCKLAHKKKLNADDLIDYNWLVYGHSLSPNNSLTDYFLKNGYPPPEVAVYSSSFATALQLVNSEGFLMTAPLPLKSIIEQAGACIQSLEPSLQRFKAGVYLRQSSINYPVVQRFNEILESLMKNDRQ